MQKGQAHAKKRRTNPILLLVILALVVFLGVELIRVGKRLNEAAQQQATDRAHRIGQTRVVSVQKVIAKGTIEERILHLQEEKSKLADQVIGAAGMSLASLSTDELIDLLGE